MLFFVLMFVRDQQGNVLGFGFAIFFSYLGMGEFVFVFLNAVIGLMPIKVGIE